MRQDRLRQTCDVRRRLLNLLTLLSLLLCVALTALWVRSYWTGDAVFSQSAREILTAAASRGQVRLERRIALVPDAARRKLERGFDAPVHDYTYVPADGVALEQFPPEQLDLRQPPGTGVVTEFRAAGFRYMKAERPHERVWHVVAPCWLVVLCTGMLPLGWLAADARRRRRTMRQRHGLCPRCGYDLRATPDTCPECGAESPAPTTTSARPSAGR